MESSGLARYPRPGDTVVVAGVAAFLAADAEQVTGQSLSVNGGLTFGRC